MDGFEAELAASVRSSSEPSGYALERSIFDSTEPERIADLLRRAITSATGSAPTRMLFYRVGSGIVVGTELADGSAVVAKAHQPSRSEPTLGAQRRLQARAGAAALPSPRAVAGPTPVGRGLLTIDAFNADGVSCADLGPEWSPKVRQLIAEALFTIGALDHGYEIAWNTTFWPETTWGTNPWPVRKTGALYPDPHSPVFDFDATGAGAEWIDAIAERALAAIAAEEPRFCIVTHADLRAENVRVDTTTGRLAVIWDWDSLTSAPEVWHVGTTARAFSLDFSRNGGTGEDIGLPTVAEMLAFVDDYEHVRGRWFTSSEKRLISAHLQHALAYSARCEHALNMTVGRVRWRPTFADRLRELLSTRHP